MIFGVGQLNYASQIWLKQTLVAMVTKICDFQYKIGYNLACARDTAQMLARNSGFSGSANLMVSVKLCSDDPCCHAPNIWFSGSVNLTMQKKFVTHKPLLSW